MKYVPVYQVMIVKDGSVPTADKRISKPAQAHEILNKYLAGADREHFIVMLLNTKNDVIGINTVSIGSLSASLVHPREVFKPAILSNAASVILSHNHPSGDPTPSPEDLSVTRKLHEAGNLLGLPVRDHIVIGDNNFFSFREQGLLSPA